MGRPIGCSLLCSCFSLGSLARICCLHASNLTRHATLLLQGRIIRLILSIVTWLLLHLVHHLLQGGRVLHQLLQVRRVHPVLLQHLIHHKLVQELLLLLIGCRSLWEARFVIKTLLELRHLCGILLERSLVHVGRRYVLRRHHVLALWDL